MTAQMLKNDQRQLRKPVGSLKSKLAQNERLIWWSRGSGRTLDATVVSMILLTITVWAVFISVMTIQNISLALDDITLELFCGFALFNLPLIFGLVRFFLGAKLEVYALTDSRVLAYQSWCPFIGKSVVAHADHLWRPPIKRLEVSGTNTLGRVRMRGLEGRDHRSASPFILRGIDNPLEVATTIKQTLNLNLTLKDKTQP
ncbi:MAG: hypothetical protein AAGI03_16120 [Pseudomonadota bacterium]